MPDYFAAGQALEKAAKALRMPPPPRVAAKAEQDDAERYEETLAAIVYAALTGEIARAAFVEQYTAAVAAELENVYRAELGDSVDDSRMSETIEAQTQYVARLADDIYGGKYAPAEEKATKADDDAPRSFVARLRSGFLGGIVARIGLWVNGRVRIRNTARTHTPADPETGEDPLFVWRLGRTERHCRDCLAANGTVHTAAEWANLAAAGIAPQSSSLECGGWNCDCSLEPAR